MVVLRVLGDIFGGDSGLVRVLVALVGGAAQTLAQSEQLSRELLAVCVVVSDEQGSIAVAHGKGGDIHAGVSCARLVEFKLVSSCRVQLVGCCRLRRSNSNQGGLGDLCVELSAETFRRHHQDPTLTRSRLRSPPSLLRVLSLSLILARTRSSLSALSRRPTVSTPSIYNLSALSRHSSSSSNPLASSGSWHEPYFSRLLLVAQSLVLVPRIQKSWHARAHVGMSRHWSSLLFAPEESVPQKSPTAPLVLLVNQCS